MFACVSFQMELSCRKAFLFKIWYTILAVKHFHTVFVIIRKLFAEDTLTEIIIIIYLTYYVFII